MNKYSTLSTFTSPARSCRQGVSLLEVMFSVGIICVGLLGVAILVPVGGKAAKEGSNADRSARDGQNWINEFRLRGYANPVNWVDNSGSAVYYNQSTSTFVHDKDMMGNITDYVWEKSFCIDPRNVAANGDSVFPKPNASVTVSCPTMKRVTLRSDFTSSTSGAMGADLAMEAFISQDELTLDFPGDPGVVSKQVYLTDTSATPTEVKREYDGHISWMATVTPKTEGFRLYRDFYTLSVVVFAHRDSGMAVNSTDVSKPDNERVVEVSDWYGSGFGGGDVQLKSTNSKQDLKLKRGDWVMLAGYTPVQNTAGTATLALFKWYRVLSAGDDPNSEATTGPWTREVTLQGPDWDSSAVTSTQAIIVSNVIAVYEKTIRLEATNLWTN